jgi:ABC-type transport system involved in multi-copper enzyme maturation permease subunit
MPHNGVRILEMHWLTRRRNLSLPLLQKELQEQSARARTYVLRVVFAVLLILSVGLSNIEALNVLGQTIAAPGANLGYGRPLFHSTIWILFIGVYLFLPAMVCGVLTVEKERNTLGLLLITKLGPWTIIIEKFASRVLPMFTFLFISLPMLAFMYSLGGLEPITLFLGLWFLFLSVLQVASLAVLASSFFSGTVGSFLGTYFLIALLSFGPPLLEHVVFNDSLQELGELFGRAFLVQFFGDNGNLEMIGGQIFTIPCFPPVILQFNLLVSGNDFVMRGGSPLGRPYLFGIFCGLPTLISAGVSLALARFFLVRRAFIASSNPLLNIFKWLDTLFGWANQRFTSGIILVKESTSVPDLDPVAWRETAKRSLGQFRYLVRVFVALEFPTLFLVLLAANGVSGTEANGGPVSAMLFILWTISLVMIAVTASNLIAGERSRQTLDVLLVTPITGRQLILQKLRGVQRLMLVVAIPLLTCIAFQTWWRTQLGSDQSYQATIFANGTDYGFVWIEYLVTGLANLVILFHLTMWAALGIGLKMTSPTKAILTTLAVLVAWFALPMMLSIAVMTQVFPGGPPDSQHTNVMLCFLDSPAFLVIHSEFQSPRRLSPIPFLPIILNSLIYGGCWGCIRYRILSQADQRLARMQSEIKPEPAEPAA